MAAEPEPHLTVGANELDHVLRVFADFVDLKSPFTLGHSSQVAEYADAAARTLGLAADEARNVARAALVHDLGKIGVPNGIWDKQARLTSSEWERVRLHPYLTERVLSYSESLRFLAPIAGAHHERLDGSGYHRGSAGPSLGMAARILAAADAYQAMGQERPYRPKLDDETRARELASAATDGNLDRAAVQAVLSVAGQRAVWTGRPSWPAGLTDREVEVLRLISRGASKNQVAKELTISVKTAGRHVENLYAKIDVSSRAAAALFAMENGLLLP